MPETLLKLSPDRDLQCYFERPSAIAAISEADPSGFVVSGTWRQQFDWCVVEWNRDNVFEHPAFRYLPDGDLSGLTLSYEEERENCIELDSTLYPTVDWPYLRIWAESAGVEHFYQVRLKDYAVPVAGAYECATATFNLTGTPATGDYIGLAWMSEHHTYQPYATDTPESTVEGITQSVNTFSSTMKASRIGTEITLSYTGGSATTSSSTTGSNGNRVGAYGHISGAGSASWSPSSKTFSGGKSPLRWRITLDFSSLHDVNGNLVPTTAVRKMRWTYAAPFQTGAFVRSEFRVALTNWTVTGSRREYQVAGNGSFRIEDDSKLCEYSGSWSIGRGNFSGSSIHYSSNYGNSVKIRYTATGPHTLYLGSRYTAGAPNAEVAVDGVVAISKSLNIPGEDVLCRIKLGNYSAGQHTVVLSHRGISGQTLYFDFLEIARPTNVLPVAEKNERLTLATDWDTDHSIALPAERTAWMLTSMGMLGRANHYVGALWFYELYRPGQVYASASITFNGLPEPSATTTLRLDTAVINHLNLYGDTAETIAKAFELEINNGYTGVRAEAVGNVLHVYARAMGTDGNSIAISASPLSGGFQCVVSSPTLTGGVDGTWTTDTQASPRINRAVRDWTRSFCSIMARENIEVVSAFSMELQHGDTSVAAGIAQRYPNGAPVYLNTPALQTNFSPISLAYWREVYKDMAQVMQEAGVRPFLQFGEVQWWYFPLPNSGMPFYDAYTMQTFEQQYGKPMRVIPARESNPALYPEEVQFLPTLIGQFCRSVREYVRQFHPDCVFEVLYPTDVNDSDLNHLINYPADDWTPEHLVNLKTESFTYTFERNLTASERTINYGESRGFERSARSFLVGISDATCPWEKEALTALGKGLNSIVLFALDQFALVGYPLSLPSLATRSLSQTR